MYVSLVSNFIIELVIVFTVIIREKDSLDFRYFTSNELCYSLYTYMVINININNLFLFLFYLLIYLLYI